MRGLRRNQRILYYQLYSDHIPVYETDLDGNIIADPLTGAPILTGDYTVGYTPPVMFRANVSANRGNSENDPFGVSTNYDNVVCSCDLSLPIDELSQLYIDCKPEDGKGPDYKVVKVARSLNCILYAVEQLPEGGGADC